MENKMAPIYAILTFAYLEENLFEIIDKNQYRNNIKTEFIRS